MIAEAICDWLSISHEIESMGEELVHKEWGRTGHKDDHQGGELLSKPEAPDPLALKQLRMS